MTDYEKAVVMAYTGSAMLVGDKLEVFYKYVSEKLGRDVYSHELADEEVIDAIKRSSFEDFKRICNDSERDVVSNDAENGAVLTKDECESLLDWMETSLIQFIRDDESIDNMKWLCNMINIYVKAKKASDDDA